MDIVAVKLGHDGHVCYVSDEKLIFSDESEKDSWPRYTETTPLHLVDAFSKVETLPDVLAMSGWFRVRVPEIEPVGGGYFVGEQPIEDRPMQFLGRSLRYFSSSHERSHIFCTYALSPFPQGQPCYVLVWEGRLGTFYKVGEDVSITKIGTPLSHPGLRYQFLYSLADPTFTGMIRHTDAGKLMALCAYGQPGIPRAEEQEVIDYIFGLGELDFFSALSKQRLMRNKYYNCGVQDPDFVNLARRFSDELFARFRSFALKELDPGLPLLIAGGCGLNCDWNRAWEETGHFSDVFVPPCTNDTGSAIGTAAEAQFHYTGRAKVTWDVYAGQAFVRDEADLQGYREVPLDLEQLAERLARGGIVAWVQGRCEIGPRALGNRSILAMPFDGKIRDRLNRIKGRESFRPIAPVCLEEDMAHHFDRPAPSPHMLFFQRVSDSRLAAITHVDESARCQSVSREQNPALHSLLEAFKKHTGAGVLCNTSLNFNGGGFINRLSDLVRYARKVGLDAFVVENSLFVPAHEPATAGPV